VKKRRLAVLDEDEGADENEKLEGHTVLSIGGRNIRPAGGGASE
jgi:hypothetical protein